MGIKDIADKFIAAKRQMEAEVQAAGKDAIPELFTEFFAAHPEVEKVAWTQYSPHFNDGEPCVFRLNGLHAKTKEHAEDDSLYDWTEGGTYSSATPLERALAALDARFEEMEQILEQVFGDGYKITVSRDGAVEVEEYDHD